jgi:hypothetical protein
MVEGRYGGEEEDGPGAGCVNVEHGTLAALKLLSGL